MIKYKSTSRGILKDGHAMFADDIASELNRKAALERQRGKFRKYMLDLEQYYMDESLKTDKPFVEEQEKRISLLCSHILQEYDEAI